MGAAVRGPMKGENLKPLESTFTRWGTWKGLYPDSKILTSGRRFSLGLRRDPYESYYRSPDIYFPTRLSDKRVYRKEFVLGLVINGKSKAYPFSALSAQPVVNDVFEGDPILVVFEKDSATGMVFKRKRNDRILSFKQTQLKGQKGIFLADDATGSIWNGLTGRAIQGKLKGKNLDPLPVTPAFWFGWVDHYPETKIFTAKK